MIRLTLVSTAVLVAGLYAWKDWYKALCALIVMMAFLEHPDMPRSIFGIQGLNLWNLLLLVTILAWLAQRKRDRLVWDLPQGYQLLLICFLMVVTTAFLRLIADRHALPTDTSVVGLISEYLVNPLKWIIPGILLFDGTRSRSRLLWGLTAILSLYLALGLQVIRWMPSDVLFSRDALVHGSQRRLLTEIGYHRVDLSVILAGASWSLLAARTLVLSPSRGALVLIAAGVVTFAQVLTGGRGGYFAWVVVGLILTLLRWRRYLLLAPALALGLSLLPGVADRALEGLSHNTDTGPAEDVDVETLTAGRNLFWPLVIDKIAEQPIVGHGRKAMERTGLSAAVVEELGENGPDNPHSAYLEMLLDCGWVGLAVTLALFGYILVNSLSLIRDRRSTVFIAIGGVTSALVIAQLVGSVTGQSFYPREGTLGMWCAIGLMLRVAVERARALATSAFVGTKSVRSLNWWTTGPSPLPPSTTVPRPIGEAQGWWQPTPSSPATSLDAYLWSESTGHPALQEHTICEAR